MAARIEPIALHEATRERYLNYALSVITSRALPDVRDGLKPVQRRILYAMYHGLKLTPDARHRKSAAVVGEVMAKYHPHGDQAIYDAMVRMAQDFSLRYPLVDGQGNYGSLDGDSAAAMRYTEARLQPLSSELLSEIGKQTVAFRPNYDGQMSEPVVLPARLPNLLLNGATGIAVGMATNIPPHNLREVVRACVALIEDRSLTVRELMRWIKGPDFPTGGRILNDEEELLTIYEEGQGAVQLAGEYTVESEEERSGAKRLVITSIPYAINKASLVEKIAEHIRDGNIPQLRDVRDESTAEVRIVCDMVQGADPEVAVAYLYKHTPLMMKFHGNLTCLVPTDNPEVPAPARTNLAEMLNHFLDYRFEVVTRRLQYDLDKLEHRISILEAFAAIFGALDEAIAIIRSSEGRQDAARGLMERFELSREQADAILDTRLYKLAKLEIEAILDELRAKRKEAEGLRRLLGSEGARWALISDEFNELSRAYGDKRRSVVRDLPDAVTSYSEEDYIVSEDAFVIITREGWFKRQRSYGDVSTIRVRDNDEVGWIMLADTRESVIVFTSEGRAYTMRVDLVPATSGYGEPIQAHFDFADGERVVGVSCTDPRCDAQLKGSVSNVTVEEDDPPPPYIVAVSRSGYALRLAREPFEAPSNSTGRRLMRLFKEAPDGEPDGLVAAELCAGDEWLCMATGSVGLAVPLAEVPLLKGPGRGTPMVRIDEGDAAIGAALTVDKMEGLEVETPRGRREVVTPSRYLEDSNRAEGTIILKRGGLIAIAPPPVEIHHLIEEDDDPDAPSNKASADKEAAASSSPRTESRAESPQPEPPQQPAAEVQAEAPEEVGEGNAPPHVRRRARPQEQPEDESTEQLRLLPDD
ncbi:MAG: DNA topoisomerase [Myxococcales bacterium]|nr:DNA topoisomerase [Myxococcales bacterium]